MVFARRQNHTEIVQMLTLAGAVVLPVSLRDALLMDNVDLFAKIWKEEKEAKVKEAEFLVKTMLLRIIVWLFRTLIQKWKRGSMDLKMMIKKEISTALIMKGLECMIVTTHRPLRLVL